MANDLSGAHVGRRLREIRLWRGLSIRAVAELAGFSTAYLSLIERGGRPVERRATLEALAEALRVAPSELTGTPLLREGVSVEHAAVASLRTALGEFDLDDADRNPPPWEHIRSRVDLVNELRPKAEYVQLGAMLPDLLRDLYASLDGTHRRAALVGLADCYLSSLSACKNLGFPDLAHVAALRIRDVAGQLADAEWTGLAAYARAQAIGSGARERAGQLAVRAADDISGELDRPEVAEVYGMLHLMAALANTTRGDYDQARAHVAEAAETAERPGVGEQNFMHMWFSRGNVSMWETMLAVESGKGGRAVEIARAVNPDALPPAQSRQGMWWIDIGRGLAMERGNRDAAVRAFRKAEDLAPQITRANPWVREAVTGLLSRAQRDAGGRELRGLAYRIGIAG